MKIERITIEQIRADREKSRQQAAAATEQAFLHFAREGITKEPSPWSAHKPEPEPAEWWTPQLMQQLSVSILFLAGFAWLLFG